MSYYSDAAITETYEIERTVEIRLQSRRTFRLEVRRMVKGADVEPYSVMAYERMTLYRTPDGAITPDAAMPNAVPFHVWVRDLNLQTYSHHQSTPEDALSVALELLVEHRNSQDEPW
jgi:hypothetical protein